MKLNGEFQLISYKMLFLMGKKTQRCCLSTTTTFLLAAGILFLSGCIIQEYKNLQITIESVPSWADVYGVAGPRPGHFIGKTPLVLVYTRKNGKIFGKLSEQTIEYTDRALIFKCYIKKQGYGTYRMYEVVSVAGSGSDRRGSAKPTFGGQKTYTAGLYKLPGDQKIQ
jgi:hypothetical protein